MGILKVSHVERKVQHFPKSRRGIPLHYVRYTGSRRINVDVGRDEVSLSLGINGGQRSTAS